MAEKFKDVVDFNNGNYTMTLGNDSESNHLDLGTYTLRLDYEAKNSLEAYQMSRKIIVGRRAYVNPSTARGVFSTSQTTNNNNITDEEKLNSTCTFNVKVQDLNTGTTLVGIPLKIGFGIDDSTIYGEVDDPSATLLSKYNSSKKLDTTFVTNSSGIATINFKVSDFFDVSNLSQIDGTHTIYVCCIGTTDRGNTDNYVKSVGYAPCVLGNTPVMVYTKTVLPEANGYCVCGGGYMAFGVQLQYSFIYKTINENVPSNNRVNVDWSSWTTTQRNVKVGHIYAMVSDNGTDYTRVPDDSYIAFTPYDMDLDTTGVKVASDGRTVFAVRNNKPYNYTGTLYYKIMYTAKAGDTNSRTLFTIQADVDKNNPSAVSLKADIGLVGEQEPIMMVAGSGRNVNVAVYDEGDTNHQYPLNHGELEYVAR